MAAGKALSSVPRLCFSLHGSNTNMTESFHTPESMKDTAAEGPGLFPPIQYPQQNTSGINAHLLKHKTLVDRPCMVTGTENSQRYDYHRSLY